MISWSLDHSSGLLVRNETSFARMSASREGKETFGLEWEMRNFRQILRGRGKEEDNCVI